MPTPAGCLRKTSALKPSGSAGSGPAIVVSMIATSVTVRARGPAESKFKFLGAIPLRLTNPVVGRRPTRPLDDAGPRTGVVVWGPTASQAKFAARGRPEPLLEPPVSRSRLYGLIVCPITVL